MKIIDFSHLIHAVAHPVQAAAQDISHFFQQPPRPPVDPRGIPIANPNTGIASAGPMNLNTRTLGVRGTGYIPKEIAYDPQALRQGGAITQQAEKRFGFTPDFQDIANKGNPAIVGLKAAGAAGEYMGELQSPSSIQISPLAAKDVYGAPEILRHEALHRVWETMPQQREQFFKAFEQSATPQIKKLLAIQLNNPLYTKPSLKQFDDLRHADPSTQTEAHSYLPAWFSTGRFGDMPAPLRKYYSQYYNPQTARNNSKQALNLAVARQELQNKILGALGELSPFAPGVGDN